MDSMNSEELMFFHPFRDKADSLTALFHDESEAENFLGALSDEGREYIRNHYDEFHTKEELEIVAARFRHGCDEITETDWHITD